MAPSSSRLLALLAPTIFGGAAAVAANQPALCQQSRQPKKVGDFSSSGFIFKDSVEVTAFPDPKVEGVVCYISNVKRPITDRLRKDFFTDPSQTSVACCQTGPIKLVENIALGPGGEEVFAASKNIFFKTVHVRRIFDEENNSLVYVAYSSRMTQDMDEQNSRYKTSLTAISLAGQGVDVLGGV